MLWKCTFSGVWLLCKSDIFEEFECFLNEYSQEAYCLPCFGCPPHPLPRGGSRPCWDDDQHKRGEPAHPNHLLFAKVGPLIIIGPVLLVAGASLLFCSCEICSRWRFGFWFRHSDTVSALRVCWAKVNVTNVAGCGNKRREWWTQAYSKPKTCTKWNIGLNQVFAIVTLLINHPTIKNWTRSVFQFETYQPWKYTQLEELVENFFSALNIDWKPFYQFWHLKSWHFKQCGSLKIDTLMVFCHLHPITKLLVITTEASSVQICFTFFSSFSPELVSYGWGQWNLDEEARWAPLISLLTWELIFYQTARPKSPEEEFRCIRTEDKNISYFF